MPRGKFQSILADTNPDWNVGTLQEQLAPDGDVLLSDDLVEDFVVSTLMLLVGILIKVYYVHAKCYVGSSRNARLQIKFVLSQCGKIWCQRLAIFRWNTHTVGFHS